MLLEDWARKWLRRMLLTSGSFSSNKHKATKMTKGLFEGSGKKILDFADIRVPESVLKGGDNATLEELGPGSAVVI